jgi:hypothetical protein
MDVRDFTNELLGTYLVSEVDARPAKLPGLDDRSWFQVQDRAVI